MKKIIVLAVLNICILGAFADWKTDISAFHNLWTNGTDSVTLHNELDSLESTYVAHGEKEKIDIYRCNLFWREKRYEETLNLATNINNTALTAAAMFFGNLGTPSEINAAIENGFKNSANLAGPQNWFFYRYKRSIATTEEYVAVLRAILRVVETNEKTLDFKSRIKSELEANL